MNTKTYMYSYLRKYPACVPIAEVLSYFTKKKAFYQTDVLFVWKFKEIFLQNIMF